MHENYKNTPCVLIAHSLGAIMAANFLANQEKATCDAVVLIGLPTLPSELPEAYSIELIKKIDIAMLDIYGSQDLNSVKKLAPTRKLTLKKNNPLNRQIEISGADHAFTGLDETLVRSIHSWLSYVFKQNNH
jgi:alpha/beta superfamily hydrolase